MTVSERQHEAGPREVLERFRQAAVSQSVDDMSREQEALGTSASTGEFALPNILVLTVHNGQIARLRDYVNIPAAVAAL